MPHPNTLKGYEDAVPGSAGRIITQFEEQGRHRRKLEEHVVKSNSFQATLGQVLAFILFMTIVIGGGYLALLGKELAGLGTVAVAVIGGVWALLKAEGAKRADLAEKRDAGKAVVARRK